MARESIPFSAFAFGEYGLQAPYTVGFAIYRQHLLYKGWWSAQNWVRTIDGSLCPRWEPVPHALTGAPAGAKIRAAGVGFKATAVTKLWVAHDTGTDTEIYQTTAPGPGAWEDLGALGDYLAADTFDSVSAGPVTYLCSSASVWSINHNTGAIVAVNPSNGGRAIAIYGARVAVGGFGGGVTPNRIYFSGSVLDPADATTWLAGNYIDVGDTSSQIVGMWPLGSVLIIAKGPAAGTRATTPQNEWWALAGVPGVNASLRRVSLEPTPQAPWNGALLADRTVGFSRHGTFEPATFNGSRVADERFLNQAGAASPVARRLKEPGDWMLCDGATALIFREGAWSRHTGLGAYGALPAAGTIPYMPPVVTDADGTVYLIKADMTQVAAWTPTNQRPALATDAAAGTPPDAAATPLSLPEWWARDGSEVALVAVLVDFVKWGTGDAAPNQFTVDAVSMRTYWNNVDDVGGGDIVKTTPSQPSWSEAASAASASGTRFRQTLQFSPQFGNGFRIDFHDVRGVTIQKVVALVDTRKAQGV